VVAIARVMRGYLGIEELQEKGKSVSFRIERRWAGGPVDARVAKYHQRSPCDVTKGRGQGSRRRSSGDGG